MNEELLHGIVILAVRLITGVLFLFQAYDKLFRIGSREVARQFHPALKSVPESLLYVAVLFSGIAEMAGGAMLISGVLTPWAVSLLLIDMIAVAISFSMVRPMWDMQFYFPRLILLLLIALLPQAWDIFSLSRILN